MSKLEDGQVMIHGKVYDTVARRVKQFRDSEKYTGYAIVTKMLDRDDSTVVMKACIKNEKGDTIATGHAEEDRTASTINKTSALENCETSAIGRALAAFGLAGTEFASADEVAQAISKQGDSGDSTQAKQPYQNPEAPATDKQKALIAKKLGEQGISVEEMNGHLAEQYGVEVPLTIEGAGFVIEELIGAK